MEFTQRSLSLIGRVLLALYFVYPAIMKITNFGGTADYMLADGMFLVPFFLALTIVIQLGGGACLVMGYRVQPVSFILAGLVLVISIVMHDFWTMDAGLQRRN